MTKKEVIIFLESYHKQKELLKTKILTIKELEQNAESAKSIDMTSERVQGGQSVLPEYIYSKIMDLKDALVRDIYSNSIRLNIIKNNIYNITKIYNNILYVNVLYYKYIMHYNFSKIEDETHYSVIRLKQVFKEAQEGMYLLLEPLSLEDIENSIKEQSFISRLELDNFYRNNCFL